jgi:hypothetical protein
MAGLWSNSPAMGSEARAVALVCHDGIFIPYRSSPVLREVADWRKFGGRRVTQADGLLLPSCRTSDTLLSQPPLPVLLDSEHIASLLGSENQGTLAATIYGPPQDKKRNEDFALAAGLTDGRGNDHAFIAVADGVTTKTFWAERSSRIACLVALQVMAEYVLAEPNYSVGDIELVRKALGERLRKALERDRRWLLDGDAIPSDWDAETFRRFRSTDGYWYNTTLLVGLIGPNAAMMLWTGDGAIQIKKEYRGGITETSTPLRSTDDVAVENIVSLAGPTVFSGGRVEITDNFERLTLAMYTDGPDRTLQRNGDSFDVSNSVSSSVIASELESLTKLPNPEIDNYSAAVARWPVPTRKSAAPWTVESLLWSKDPAPNFTRRSKTAAGIAPAVRAADASARLSDLEGWVEEIQAARVALSGTPSKTDGAVATKPSRLDDDGISKIARAAVYERLLRLTR